MRIADPCVVSLTWQLSDGQDRLIDALVEPVEFFVGGDDLLLKVEAALVGQETGFEANLHLEPEFAFGDYRAELVCYEARSLFPPQLEAGMVFEGLPAGSVTPNMPRDVVYVVTEIYPSHVVLDGNHPLAGMSLRLHLQVQDVREAQPDEISARTVSGGMLALVLPTTPPAATGA